MAPLLPEESSFSESSMESSLNSSTSNKRRNAKSKRRLLDKSSFSSSSNHSNNTTSSSTTTAADRDFHRLMGRCCMGIVVFLAAFKTLETGHEIVHQLQANHRLGALKRLPEQSQATTLRGNLQQTVLWVPVNSTTTGSSATSIKQHYNNGLPITAVNHASEFQRQLNPNTGNYFCLPWTTNADTWWTNNPQWEIATGSETDTHYCFQKIKDQEKRDLFRDLHRIQFPMDNDCSQVYTKRSWGSGWGADFSNLIDGMQYATESGKPVQVVEDTWHYAGPDPYQKDKPACPRQNMFCYFLPISSCRAAEQGADDAFLVDGPYPGEAKHQWYYEYLTRQQTWLRKRIYDMVKSVNVTAPCTAIHVRRADVVLHDEFNRRYHAISEYLDASPQIRPIIFLLTDDQNAVEEALAKFPDRNWQYLERPRHRGAEGGWENQVPSKDPAFEVTALLAELQLVAQCDQIIRSHGNFADLLLATMRATGREIDHVDIDDFVRAKGGKVHQQSHAKTVGISKPYNISK